MNSVKGFFANYLFAPVKNFHEKYTGKFARRKYCNNVADFIFKNSKETALIMLVFNGISIISSHLSQIGGLKKSKRENKDYLINQEWKELGLDLVLTIIPPFILNNKLMKKLDSGDWTTKSARKYVIDTIAPTVGASRDELYSTDHIRPVKETVASVIEKASNALNSKTELPKSLESVVQKINTAAKKVLPDPNAKLPCVSMEDITTDFDVIRKGKFREFYNGKAYDEISGSRNGMLIMATLAYTILASNVIMPILKNKLANRAYEKQLKKQGETRESVKRKKRFSYTNIEPCNKTADDKNLFKTFSAIDNGNIPLEKEKPLSETTFDKFNVYSEILSKSSGLKI